MSEANQEVKKYGIKETKELLGLAISIVALGKSAIKKEKVGFALTVDVIKVLEKAEQGVEGFDLIDDELKDLDMNEVNEILEFITEQTGEIFKSVEDVSKYVLVAKNAYNLYASIKKVINDK